MSGAPKMRPVAALRAISGHRSAMNVRRSRPAGLPLLRVDIALRAARGVAPRRRGCAIVRCVAGAARWRKTILVLSHQWDALPPDRAKFLRASRANCEVRFRARNSSLCATALRFSLRAKPWSCAMPRTPAASLYRSWHRAWRHVSRGDGCGANGGPTSCNRHAADCAANPSPALSPR